MNQKKLSEMTDKELTAEAKRIQKGFLKETTMYWSVKAIKETLCERIKNEK